MHVAVIADPDDPDRDRLPWGPVRAHVVTSRSLRAADSVELFFGPAGLGHGCTMTLIDSRSAIAREHQGPIEVPGPVEHLAGVDAPLKAVRQQLLDVRTHRSRAATDGQEHCPDLAARAARHPVAGVGGFAKGSIQRWQSPARSVKVRIPQSRAAGRIGPTLQIAAAPQSRGRIPRFLAVAALATIVAAVAIVVATARRSGGSHRKPNTSVHATVRKLPPYWTVRPGDTLTKISDKTDGGGRAWTAVHIGH
jgi:hypothetical protein